MIAFIDHIKNLECATQRATASTSKGSVCDERAALGYPELAPLLRLPIWAPVQAAQILAGIEPNLMKDLGRGAPWLGTDSTVKLLTGEVWARGSPVDRDTCFHPNCGLSQEEYDELGYFLMPFSPGFEPPEPKNVGAKCTMLLSWRSDLVQRVEKSLAFACQLSQVMEEVFRGVVITPIRAISWANSESVVPEWQEWAVRNELAVSCGLTCESLAKQLKQFARTAFSSSGIQNQKGCAIKESGREKQKRGTAERNKKFVEMYEHLVSKYPGKTKGWYADKIIESPLAVGISSATVRRTFYR